MRPSHFSISFTRLFIFQKKREESSGSAKREMAPPRRLSNGRSPLINQQSQITKFFNKTTTPTSTSRNINNSKPNPNPSPSPSPSPNPTTPSSHQSVQEKDIKSTTTTKKKTETASLKVVSYGDEVLNKGIRVYWPLDQSWYKGHVNGFDEVSGKHKVKYEDGEEEELYLSKEKIEWVEGKVKSFRRLRKAVVEEEDKGLGKVEDDEKRDVSSVDKDGDDSSDEDWGKNVEKEVSEDELDDMVLDDEEYVVEFESTTPDIGFKKRKGVVQETSGSSKKKKRVVKATPSSDGNGNITDQINKGDSE